MKKFTFIDLFSGIGGFREALQQLGGNCVFSSECDNDAQDVYERNFNERPFGDITKILENTIPIHDVLCAGFPCQSFSISGNRKGFEDKTRGTLFYDIIRITKYHQPKVLFLENVKNIITHSGGTTLKIILSSLDEIGYNVSYKVINASEFGVPQARERVYFICTRKDLGDIKFEFPTPQKELVYLIDYLEKNITPKKITKYIPEYKSGID